MMIDQFPSKNSKLMLKTIKAGEKNPLRYSKMTKFSSSMRNFELSQGRCDEFLRLKRASDFSKVSIYFQSCFSILSMITSDPKGQKEEMRQNNFLPSLSAPTKEDFHSEFTITIGAIQFHICSGSSFLIINSLN